MLGAACSSEPAVSVGLETPEAAVVAWFESIDADRPEISSMVTYDQSLALVLGIENGLDASAVADYLNNGVPLEVQTGYWSSFADGFIEFASRPVSTLSVGESASFSSEGVNFATVPVSSGGGQSSVVITRMTDEGTWVVDMVASLGDGFVQLLARSHAALPAGEDGDRVRLAYREAVVPALWAAMASETFDDDFNRSALALIESVSRGR